MSTEERFRPTKDETLGQYLRRLRELVGFSLTEVMEQTKPLPKVQRIAPDWLSRAERDRYRHPSPEKLRTLAQLYRVPAAWILEKAGLRPLQDEDGQIVSNSITRQWPADIRLLALRASEISPAGLDVLLDMAKRIKQYEEQVGGESKDTQPHAPAP